MNNAWSYILDGVSVLWLVIGASYPGIFSLLKDRPIIRVGLAFIWVLGFIVLAFLEANT